MNQVICFSAVRRPASHILRLLVSSRVFLFYSRAATNGGWMEPDRELLLSPLAHKECFRILKTVFHFAKGLEWSLLSGFNQTAAHVWL